jgi:DNA-binding NarL/FixJ family response regulator
VIRIVFADDQDLVREGLRMMLEAEDDLEVVGEAGDGLEALDAVRTHDPDVLPIDIRMPRLGGLEATARLVGSHARTRVLVLTTCDLDEYVYRAMKAGASGSCSRTPTAPSSLPPCAPSPPARRCWRRPSRAG